MCKIGQTRPSQKSGTLWIKAKTKTATGQFPAEVKITAPDQVKMIVLNPLGGTEAMVRVDGPKLSVKTFSTGEAEKERQAFETWNGVPIRWLGELLLGRVPCPKNFTDARWDAEARLVIVETGAALTERFQFELAEREGAPVVEKLVWERGVGLEKRRVEIAFGDRSERWDVVSDQGELTLRWRP